ncbi:plasmid partitioning protein RepB C-terminal domain-containing protein [Achromobacter sp. Root565]|uniref:plasmid partitioning protein RepB C-terminal domain-containing protein n=1 Tax=Achromobacter sp. Root565 TaxID=1736564 RepID=UPI0007010BDC|nr:plasmid partitioning protein RepB C-terminal domain-containing protein [Achromobacter sp. Root565]KRA03279.1 chromosome partitioning protein ParB [Achromobacter sp. Root565]
MSILGFIPEPIELPFERILPSHKISEGILDTRKFKQIVSSIEEVGLIEPLTVGRAVPPGDLHVLLDGHIRILALKHLGFTTAPCLVATDEETYTYNNRLNRISSVQEHVMIRRAVERGVPKERLAKALSLDISSIVKKMNLLDGVCREAAELLKDQHFSANLSGVLRKLKPTRQIECVELMVTANNMTVAYAQALHAATPKEMLVAESKPKKIRGLTPEQADKMEREMSNVFGQFKLCEQSYGQDILNLVLAKGFLSKLLGNAAIHRYLGKHQQGMLTELERIVQTVSLEEK